MDKALAAPREEGAHTRVLDMARRIVKPRGSGDINGHDGGTAQEANGTHHKEVDEAEPMTRSKTSDGSNPREKRSKKKARDRNEDKHQVVGEPDKPSIRIKVRKTRFVDWKPGAVSAISVAPNQAHLAVAREAGDGRSCRAVEVWETEYWTKVLEIKAPHVGEDPGIHGGNGQEEGGHGEVTGLAWVQDGSGKCNVLVTSGLDGMLVVWDLQQKRAVRTVEAGGGAVWDMAGAPAGAKQNDPSADSSRDQDIQPSRIACACDDGRVRVFAFTPQGLEFEKVIGRAEGRALSVAWQRDAAALAVGTSDGFIRLWKANQLLGRESVCISLGDCCVWSLLLLDDGTIISGDSNGTTSFWDPQFGTLLHEFTQHEADILCIAASPSGSSVFSSGIDSKICSFERIEQEPGSFEWVYTGYKRTHSHDVHSLAVVHGSLFDGSAIISGGNDAQLFAYAADSFPSFHPVRFCRCPQLPRVAAMVVRNERGETLLSVQRDLCIEVWQMDRPKGKGERRRRPAYIPFEESPSPSLVGRVDNPSRHPIICSALAVNGGILAFSDECSTKVFRLENRGKGPKRHALVGTFPSASALCITGDGTKLCLHCSDGSLGVFEVGSAKQELSFHSHLADSEPLSEFADEVMASSLNGKWLAITSGGKRKIHIYNMKGMEYHGSLPLPWESLALITAIAFDESGDHLGACTADDFFCLFDVEERKPSAWSIKHSAKVSRKLERMSGHACYLSFCRTEHAHLAMIATPNSMCVFDINAPVVESEEVSNKRKRVPGGSTAGDQNFKVLNLSEPCLHISLLDQAELLIVEKPWLDVLETLPPPLYRHRYGT